MNLDRGHGIVDPGEDLTIHFEINALACFTRHLVGKFSQSIYYAKDSPVRAIYVAWQGF